MPISVINRHLHYYLIPNDPVYFNVDVELNGLGEIAISKIPWTVTNIVTSLIKTRNL